jgi:hypothetical protein
MKSFVMGLQADMFPWQRLSYSNEEQCFLRGPCQGVINRTSLKFSQWWDIHQPVRMLAEDIVRIHYQETTSEGIEDFMFTAVTVIFTVCKPVRLLQIPVVASCVHKCSINRITNPSPIYSHSYTWQYLHVQSIVWGATGCYSHCRGIKS